MKDFWLSCGHHLLDRDADGRLLVTDEFLKVYLARPELVPPAEACDAERALHARLMADPRRSVAAAELAGLADPDARENWQVMLAFRDRLLAAPSLEAAYIGLVRGGLGRTPPLFLNQLAQLVLRNALDAVEDPFTLRAAELFFRPQRVTVHEGATLLADAETIEVHEAGRAASPLLAMLGGPAVSELDILDEANAGSYFARSDAFDVVLNLGSDRRARAGLAAAVARFTEHLLGAKVTVEPVAQAEDADWTWFVGLDAEATAIGNALWNGDPVDAESLSRVLAILRLTFDDPSDAIARVGSRPVWLILAMSPDRMLRMKPQNLVAGLPLRALEPAG